MYTHHNKVSAGDLIRHRPVDPYSWDDKTFLAGINDRLPKEAAEHIRTCVGAVAHRVFNWTDVPFDIGGGCNTLRSSELVYASDPGYDGSVYGLGSDKWKEVTFFGSKPTYVAIYPASDHQYSYQPELIVYWQIGEDRSRAYQFRLVRSTEFTGWMQRGFKKAN